MSNDDTSVDIWIASGDVFFSGEGKYASLRRSDKEVQATLSNMRHISAVSPAALICTSAFASFALVGGFLTCMIVPRMLYFSCLEARKTAPLHSAPNWHNRKRGESHLSVCVKENLFSRITTLHPVVFSWGEAVVAS